MTRLLCALLLTTACSGGGAVQKRPTPLAEAGSGSAVEPNEAPPPAKPTPAECDALVAHVVQLTRAEQPTATADDAAQTKKNLEPFAAECATLTADRVHCATSAPSLADVARCNSGS